MSTTSCEEKVHDTVEAANCAFVADSKKINMHHASLQSSSTLEQKLNACRQVMDEEEENLPALQDGSVSGTDRDVDMFDDFSGLKQNPEMASHHYHPRAYPTPAHSSPSLRSEAEFEFGSFGAPSPSLKNGPPLDATQPPLDQELSKGGKGRKGIGKGKGLPVHAKAKVSKGANADMTLSKAREAMSKYESQFSDAKLWESKIKSRAVDTMSNALNRHASQIMCLNSQDPDDTALATRCSEFADSVSEKVKFLQGVRQAPELSATGVTDGDYACAKTMSVQVLSSVIVWVAGQLLKDFDQDLIFVDCFVVQILKYFYYSV